MGFASHRLEIEGHGCMAVLARCVYALHHNLIAGRLWLERFGRLCFADERLLLLGEVWRVQAWFGFEWSKCSDKLAWLRCLPLQSTPLILYLLDLIHGQ